MKRENIIIKVEDGSIAQELDIRPGDKLMGINGDEVHDVFDYRYRIQEEYLEVLIQKPDGEEWLLEIEKDEEEDLGLVFDSGLMDKAAACRNRCIFCFIDQLPKGMRKSLYFKDDDSRLSFLQGNYVTLTNLDAKELDRIIYYHLSPINISVHTTDAELRKFMMKNPSAGTILESLDKIHRAGIEMNFQIVLCKGVNDGAHLDKTIKDLSRYLPRGRSLSVVPVGLTRYRENLYPLSTFSRDDALRVVRQVEDWQKKCLKKHNTHFVYASDEFYLKARLPLPGHEAYEDFPQLENGVGMVTLFEWELNKALDDLGAESRDYRKITIATGMLAYESMLRACNKIKEALPYTEIQVIPIKNEFFGEEITVSGLLTGQDICSQLAGKSLGDFVIIPQNSLRGEQEEDRIFLDNMSLKELEARLGLPVRIGRNNGGEFLKKGLL